ncbi:MAG: TraK domain-containing protein [Alphaproteobacteria bacterium]
MNMNRHFSKKSVELSLCLLWSILSIGASLALEIPLREQKILPVLLSSQAMTRIWVKDDRIQQLFGMTEDVVLETDDEHGQIFLKILGNKPVYVTLVTEAGVSQELKLIPKKKDPEPLMLVSRPKDSSNVAPSRGNTLAWTAAIFELRNIARTLPQNFIPKPSERLRCLRAKSSGLEHVSVERLYQQDTQGVRRVIDRLNYKGAKFLNLSPSCLAQVGEVALGIERTQLEPGQSTLLYGVEAIP